MEQQAAGLTSDVSLVTQRPAAVSPVVPLQSVASAGGHPSQASAITCLPTQAMAAALTTPTAEDRRHNDIALRCEGNTELQAVGSTPQASQQRLNGGCATGIRPAAATVAEAAAAMEEATAAESAAITYLEEAAVPEAEAAAAATEEAAPDAQAAAAAMQEAVAPEAGAAATGEAAAPEAATAATNKAAAAEAAAPEVAVTSTDEAAALEAATAATNEAAIPEAAPTVARASQIVPDSQGEAQSVVKQTSSKNAKGWPLKFCSADSS